nr:hypothetical protein L203_03986 [Cryptococcus depauperatus CBS 7841]
MSNEISILSLDTFIRDSQSPEALHEAQKATESLIRTGALIICDTRAPTEANDRFLDLLEDYFSQDEVALKMDERPELGFQVGVTLENTEKPKCASDANCQAIIASLDPSERPQDLKGLGADPKCRFFHRMSEKPPYQSRFPVLEAPNVQPRAFAETWEKTLNDWGVFMKQAVEGVARMMARGLGLEEETFLNAGRYGHVLIFCRDTTDPLYGKLDTVFAGFHTDLNFLTIHGQSRYPGLHIWARNVGKKIAVELPFGCMLVQAGKQLEWLTGGLIKAGYHEVVCTRATLDREEDKNSLIAQRFFWHLTPDFELSPIPSLKQEADERFGKQEDYGKMFVGDQIKRELGLIALMPAS